MIQDRYTVLASVYDFFFNDDYTDRIYKSQKKELLNLFSDRKASELDVLEVGCGTGRMTLKLLDFKSVTAIDASSEMLSVLETKIRKLENKPFLLQTDFLELEFTKKFDIVIMCLDVFNYFSRDEVQKVFEKAQLLLNDGGVFAFDFSSEYKLRDELGDNTIAQDFDDFAFIWENSLNEELQCVNFDFTLFERQDNGLYRKSTERHRQYIHKLSDVIAEGRLFFDSYTVYKDYILESFDLDKIHCDEDGCPDRYYVYFKKGK